MKWATGSSETLFGVGAKYALDSDASLHAKVNNKSLIGLGYQQKLRQGKLLSNPRPYLSDPKEIFDQSQVISHNQTIIF